MVCCLCVVNAPSNPLAHNPPLVPLVPKLCLGMRSPEAPLRVPVATYEC